MKQFIKKLECIFLLTAMVVLMQTGMFFAADIPADIKNVSAKAVSETEIEIKWRSAKDADEYVIYLWNVDQKSWIRYARTQNLSYVFKKAVPGVKYTFAVRGQKDSRMSKSFSERAAAKTTIQKPDTPSDFRLTQYGNQALTLSWKKAEGANGYFIYRYNEEKEKYEQIGKTSKTSFTDTGLKVGKKYYYRIKSVRVVKKVYRESKISGAVGATAIQIQIPTIHGRYHQATVKYNSTVRISGTTKKITIKAGTKGAVAVKTYGNKSVNFKLNNGTVVVIYGNRLSYGNLYCTTKYYTAEQQELYLNAKGYSSNTGYFIWINQYTTRVSVFKGSRGNWKRIRQMPCVIGTYGKTPQGLFRIINHTWLYGGLGMYFTFNHYTGLGNAFHQRVDGNYNGAHSHGCVRLGNSDLSFLYNTCPNGTPVLSY